MYFVTICTQNRICRFGEIVGAAGPWTGPQMTLNDVGKMNDQYWQKIIHTLSEHRIGYIHHHAQPSAWDYMSIRA